MIIPCCGDLRELKGIHHHKVVEITENAGNCLLNEYMVISDFKHTIIDVVCYFILISDVLKLPF